MGDVYFTALDFVASLNPSSSRKQRPMMNMNNVNHVENMSISSDVQQQHNGSKFSFVYPLCQIFI